MQNCAAARARASARAADRFCIAQNTKARRVTHTRASFFMCVYHMVFLNKNISIISLKCMLALLSRQHAFYENA